MKTHFKHEALRAPSRKQTRHTLGMMDSRYEEGDRRIHALGTMGEIDKNTLWA